MASAGLEVRSLKVTYGGNVAIRDVSFAVPPGVISGLIGPNGAGKTTIFNACSGLLRPAAGSVNFLGQDVTRRSAAARARLGLGRTFQLPQVVNSMSVERNVMLGAECRLIGNNPLTLVGGGRAQQRKLKDAAEDAMAECGITAMGSTLMGSLSTGRRRLVELARVLAGGYSILLLDEPSSGLDDEETDEFGEILRRITARGPGILLVEHDMGLVMSVCRHISVLDFGHLIFEGSPADVQASPAVRSAYLGEESTAEVGA
jgi:ABC-type branched-subunit amino acid transport system ATPase component